MDLQNLFSDDQAITATANSTNVIDLVNGGTAVSPDLRVMCQVTEDFATLTSLTVTLTTSASEDMSSSTTLASSSAIAVADLVAGKDINLGCLPEDADRYLRLTYTVAGSNATAGKITAGLVLDK